ncbi:hypothetical protein CTP10_R35500 [Cupriavidus sp. P-10]|uniref:hypothetical protein n=1 Tax=Cupriavidus sp. P-10 TaxID=2027911 RepID=UPI0011C13D79|nr:hypothetical protein [Cupriavidus sp. P-10]BDB26155.1 hypothetical protein CTP10_R35500 [Cupriavidus sp. P-10]
MKTFIKFFIVGLLSAAGFANAAAELKCCKVIFFGNESCIEYHAYAGPDGDQVALHLLGRERINVAVYEPEGGALPRIVSVFTSGKSPKKLFVIVAWRSDNSVLNTGGSVFQVFVYDEKMEYSKGSPSLVEDTLLGNRFGAGFDGIREGKRISYKYKNAESVRRQLVTWKYR